MPDPHEDERDTGAIEESKAVSGESVASRLGWLTGESAPGSLVVDYDGNPFGHLHARGTRLSHVLRGRDVGNAGYGAGGS
jgi:hypothetical protein